MYSFDVAEKQSNSLIATVERLSSKCVEQLGALSNHGGSDAISCPSMRKMSSFVRERGQRKKMCEYGKG